MLTYRGKLYGDLTVACLDENEFMVFGSGAAQEMHRRWFENHLVNLMFNIKIDLMNFMEFQLQVLILEKS
jgi:dimethylglycine dehydrogenase